MARVGLALRFGWRAVAGVLRGGWVVVVAPEEQVVRRGDGSVLVLPRDQAEREWAALEPGRAP